MAFWLMKSEPSAFSIQNLCDLNEARWDGVRNYQARNFLREMQVGDLFFFYHSSCPQPGIVGIGEIVAAAYPDPSALEPENLYFDPKSSLEKNRWSAVDVRWREQFALIELAALRHCEALAELPLVQRGSRLSVMPVSEMQWRAVLALRN